jgi:hypothetical protein
MPSKHIHIQLAHHNDEVLEYLLKGTVGFHDWVVIVAFYKAVHLVEALFAIDGIDSSDHNSREKRLKRRKTCKPFYKDYRALREASMVARYLGGSSGTYRHFSEYMTPQRVKDEILHEHLKNVEDATTKLMSEATA